MTYQTPFQDRYASEEMLHLFSREFKYTTWRRLWVALAKGQKSLGMCIEDSQIACMEKAVADIDFDRVGELERQTRHEVMAHIHAFGEACPSAKGVIHMGATSAYVMDNTDLIQMKAAMQIICSKVLSVLESLSHFALKYSDLAVLGYTHLQMAQPTTLGKRVATWIQDLKSDFQMIQFQERHLPLLGAKGAVGTQDAFLSMLGSSDKVEALDRFVAKEMGFDHIVPIATQTYPRKIDTNVVFSLSNFGASTHKMATDLRLLSHMDEIHEPFGEGQVGSSAMPYKCNPMRMERVCSLSRFLMNLVSNTLQTASLQWLERSLDDSANRRITLPEAFLCADSILNILGNTLPKLKVHVKVIQERLRQAVPFLSVEQILVKAVSRHVDRQLAHDLLQDLTNQAKQQKNKREWLLEQIAKEKRLKVSKSEVESIFASASFTGRAKEQTLQFLKEEIAPLLSRRPYSQSTIPQLKI